MFQNWYEGTCIYVLGVNYNWLIIFYSICGSFLVLTSSWCPFLLLELLIWFIKKNHLFTMAVNVHRTWLYLYKCFSNEGLHNFDDYYELRGRYHIQFAYQGQNQFDIFIFKLLQRIVCISRLLQGTQQTWEWEMTHECCEELQPSKLLWIFSNFYYFFFSDCKWLHVNRLYNFNYIVTNVIVRVS